MYSEMKELIGKIILEIKMLGDHSYIQFMTDQGPIAYQAYGDCCSETWFADITGVAALIGARVASVEDMPMDNYNVEDGRCRQEYDQAYGHKIVTEKGYADIVYRNSSNGYYGGSLELAEIIDIDSFQGTITITDDWSA